MNKKEIISKLEYWTNFSMNEGIQTIIDISGKKFNKDINKYYKLKGINHLLAQYWTKWDKKQKDVELLVIPDESGLCEEVIETVTEYYIHTTGKVMLHVLESEERKKCFLDKYNMSTIEWLEKNNLLNDRTYLVHMNAASQKDFEIVKHYNSHVVLCPSMRIALSNPEPKLIPNLNLHFGTDGPIATNEYSLLKQGYLQYEIWKNKMDENIAAKLAIKSLFSSPYSKKNRKIVFEDIEELINNGNKFIEIIKSFGNKSRLKYKVIKDEIRI